MNPTLVPGETALILIDFQHGTLSFPLTPHTKDQILSKAVLLGNAIAAAGGIIIPVNVAFSDDGGDRLRQPLDIPMMLPEGGFPPEWSQLHDDIANLPSAAKITKRHWSAFFATELDLQLRRRGIANLITAGIATNFGVESTARDAWQHGYNVVIASDACSSVGEGAHDFALRTTLPRVSRVRSAAEIIDDLVTS